MSTTQVHPPHTVQFPSLKPSKHRNYIRTTKYTLFTFLPLNLYFQFKRLYNIYFLAAALTTLSGYSSLSPITQILPLLLVLLAAALKDAFEDFARYKQDRSANNAKVTVVRGGKKLQILAKDVGEGDIVYYEKGEKFSVDAVLLSTSFDDGSCFVDTAELDGETNLKRRTAPHELIHLSLQSISQFRGKIESEPPNQNLLSFEGRISISSLPIKSIDSKTDSSNSDSTASSTNSQILPLSISNLLLRGAVLRNTDFAFAVVLYTGPNTKIMKNLKKAGQKRSRLEKSLNKFVFAAFLFNMALLLTSVMLELSYFWYARSRPAGYLWYLAHDWNATSQTTQILADVLSFFAIYTYVIPISLFVTIEIARLAQGLFMRWDKKMMYDRPNPDGTFLRQYMRPNNTNLNEDLGMVEYVFSDKTGTLTQNNMVLAKFFINGHIFDELSKEASVHSCLLSNTLPDSKPLDPATREYAIQFLRALSLAHDVLPSVENGIRVYESSSPDETALLNAAASNEFKLLEKTKAATKISTHVISKKGVDGKLAGASLGSVEYSETPIERSYKPLNCLEFSSDRKRMSIILRRPCDDKIVLFCKGADNIMLSRLDPSPMLNPPALLKHANEVLQKFSEEGLRTLVIAWRELSEAEYTDFSNEYSEAERSVGGNREEMLAKACEKVERNFTFLGSTAIEDKLQDGVPETIDYLLQAGIKVWLLTGDKQETAINIGYSSKLLNSSMSLHILKGSDTTEVLSKMRSIASDIEQNRTSSHALVVNGDALSIIFSKDTPSAEIQAVFLAAGTGCRSVICCRVTPLQKAMVVKLVKNAKNCITLAIGDGANDVSMIQSANIGVGIMGREGTQAVRASDYAFAEFRFLRRLMAVHGRYSYMRIATIIMFSFYKNIVMINIFWWFGWVSMFSGSIPFEEVFMTAYNVAFLALPPLVMCVFDRDVNDDYIEKYPQLYRQAREGAFWNWKTVAGWIMSALFQCTVIFGSIYFINRDGNISGTGRTTGYWVQTSLLGTPLLLTVLLKFCLATKTFVWPTWFSVALSIVLNTTALFILELLGFSEAGTGVIGHISPVYYLTAFLLPIGCNIVDLTFMYVKRQYLPHDADIICEKQKVAGERPVDVELRNL